MVMVRQKLSLAKILTCYAALFTIGVLAAIANPGKENSLTDIAAYSILVLILGILYAACVTIYRRLRKRFPSNSLLIIKRSTDLTPRR